MNRHRRTQASLFLSAVTLCTMGVAGAARAQQAQTVMVAEADGTETTVVAVGAGPVAGPPANAEIAPVFTPRFRIGAEVALGIPLNDHWSSLSAVALGGHVRFAWDFHPHVGLTARAGYLHGIGGDGYDFGLLPFMVGAEYRFLDGSLTPFVGAELGATIGWASANTGYGRASDTDGAFALSIGGGMRFGRFDVRADLYTPDIDDLVGIRLAIGGDFAVF